MTVYGKIKWLARKSISGNNHSSMKKLMEIKKKKCVLLKDEASNWLQIWMTVYSPDVKNKSAIKISFLLTGWFSQIWSHII